MGMVIDKVKEREVPVEASVSNFSVVVAQFMFPLLLLAKLWQWILGHMASLENFVPHGHLEMCPLQWHLRDRWLPVMGDPSALIPWLQEVNDSIVWWMDATNLEVGVPLSSPALFLLLVLMR